MPHSTDSAPLKHAQPRVRSASYNNASRRLDDNGATGKGMVCAHWRSVAKTGNKAAPGKRWTSAARSSAAMGRDGASTRNDEKS